MRELERINELVGRAGSYASLRFSTDTADPARGALLQRVQERATEIETKLLFFELEWAARRRRARRAAARRRRTLDASAATTCAAPAATGPTCCPSPRRRSWPRSRSRANSAWAPPVRRAGVGAAGRRSTTSEVPLDVALSRLQFPTATTRRAAAEAVTGALEPGLRTRAFIYNTLRPRQVRRRPAAPLPALAGQPQPCQRGLRRVGDGADRGGPRAATTSRSAGTALKAQLIGRRPARRLRPDGPRAAGGGRSPSARPASWCSTPTTPSRPRPAGSPAGSSTSAGSTPRCGRTSAAARSAPTRSPASTRT